MLMSVVAAEYGVVLCGLVVWWFRLFWVCLLYLDDVCIVCITVRVVGFWGLFRGLTCCVSVGVDVALWLFVVLWLL